MTSAANVDVEPIWATLLAKALEGKNVKELLSNVGSGGGAPAAGSAATAAPSDSAVAPVEEPPKEEDKEESDDDMVRASFDLQPFRISSISFFTLSRASDFSINLLYYIRFEEFVFIASPMWIFAGAHSMSILLSPSDTK